MMEQWQYLKRVDPSEKQLNELGGLGWELIAIAPVPPLHNKLVYLFKRKSFPAALLNSPSEIEGLSE